MKNILNIIDRNKNLFEEDIFSLEKELEKTIGSSSFLVIGGAGSIGQSVTAEIFKRNPKLLHVIDISENIDLIEYQDLENFVNLPVIFGDEKNFEILFNELKKINFPFEIIKTFYFFETKRWDLETHKGKTIKLPVKNYKKNLKNFLILKEKNNFDTYKIFDYRIKNQLILK